MNLTLNAASNSLRLTNQQNTLILRATGAFVTSQAQGATYVAAYNEVYPVTFYIIPESQALDEIAVRITESFDGVGASLKLGDDVTSDRFFTTSEVELTEADLTFQKGFDTDGEVKLVLTIVPGVGATQGEVSIQLSTTKKGV